MAAVTPLPIRTEAPESTDLRPQLEKLLRERVRKCVTLLPRVLSEDDPEAVHDLRVWSRRLQQVIVTLFPDARVTEARVMVRALRRARRSLGGWRDCDVVIALLMRKIRCARNPEQKNAWEKALATARRELQREKRRARRKIANRKMFTLAQRAEDLILRRSLEAPPEDNVFAALEAAIAAAYSQWRDSLVRARSSSDPAEVHAFRIQTKRLRYRMELLRDVGSVSAKSALSSLRSLQDELGRWHDGLAFARITAEALADPEYLLAQPLCAAAILRKLERENVHHLKRVHGLLNRTSEHAETSPLHAAIAEFHPAPVPDTGDTAAAPSEVETATS